ncbi:MAG: hypothetical protein COV45_03235, partial [Deltaproteobacteria bacterium CG11_big_fil_rev_8_21_14_0_20_47_16]
MYDPATNTYVAAPATSLLAGELGATTFGAHSFVIPSGAYAGYRLSFVSTSNDGGGKSFILDESLNNFVRGPYIGAKINQGSNSFVITSGPNSGKTLVIVGNSTRGTRIYDPLTNTFGPGPDASIDISNRYVKPFYVPSGVLAGKTISIKSASSGGDVTTVYDPTTNTFSPGPSVGAAFGTGGGGPLPGAPFEILTGSQAGKILIIGASSNGASLIRLYDPLTNTFSAGPALGGNRASSFFPIATGPQAGKTLAIQAFSTGTRMYDPASNTFSAGPNSGVSSAVSLSFPITSGNYAGKTMVFFGNASRIYDPETNTFLTGPNFLLTIDESTIIYEVPEGKHTGKTLLINRAALTFTFYNPVTNLFEVGPAVPTSFASQYSWRVPVESGPNAGKLLLVLGTTGSVNSTFIYTPQKPSYNFTSVNIPSGTMLTGLAPDSAINVANINVLGDVLIEGTINLTAKGYAGGGTALAGYGPGSTTGSTGGGCGGSYGGVGGVGGNTSCTPAVAYTSDDSGSGGSGGASSAGGAGGGAIIISSGGSITIGATGSIVANGNAGVASGASRGGGGSGGLIKLLGTTVTNSGSLTASGGVGGNGTINGGGGGGAGRVSISYNTAFTPGTITTVGGAGGTPNGVAGGSLVYVSASTNPILYVLGGQNSAGVAQSTISQAMIDSGIGSVGVFGSSANALLEAVSGLTANTFTLGSDTYIYIIGGHNGSTDQPTVYKLPLDSVGTVNAGSTTNQTQLASGISHHTTTTGSISSTNYIWVIGGLNGSTAQSTVYKGTIDSSGDIVSLTTSGQASLPQGLYGHATYFDTVGSVNYLYVTGGTTTGGAKQSTVYRAVVDASGNVGAFSTVGQ